MNRTRKNAQILGKKEYGKKDGGKVKTPSGKTPGDQGLVPVDVPMQITRCAASWTAEADGREAWRNVMPRSSLANEAQQLLQLKGMWTTPAPPNVSRNPR